MKKMASATTYANSHLARANRVRFNRKRFAVELALIVLVGGVFGYATSDFFFSFVTIDLNAEPPLPATWKDTGFVTFSLFGVFIWPAVFAAIYLIWARKRSSKLEAQQWAFEEELREKRKIETQARIEEAQNSGALDRFESSK